MKFVITFCLTLLAANIVCADDYAQELIRMAEARSEAVVSGQLTYEYERTGHKKFGSITIAFEGDNWAWTYEKSMMNAVKINKDNVNLHYFEKPLPNGKRSKELNLMPSVNLKEKYRGIGNRPPFYAGSFLTDLQKEWAIKSIKDFQVTGKAVINGVDTVVLEAMPKHTYCYHFVHIRDNTVREKKLKWYIAPSKGGVIMQMENYDEKGNLLFRHVCSDLKDVGSGIWWPRYIKTMNAKGNDEKLIPEKLEKKGAVIARMDINLVNQDIPEEKFSMDIPTGTKVFDGRNPEKPFEFTVRETTLLEVLPATLDAEIEPNTNSFLNWKFAVGLGLILSAVFGVIVYLRRSNA